MNELTWIMLSPIEIQDTSYENPTVYINDIFVIYIPNP